MVLPMSEVFLNDFWIVSLGNCNEKKYISYDKKCTGKPLKYKIIGAEASSDLNLFGLVVKYIDMTESH